MDPRTRATVIIGTIGALMLLGALVGVIASLHAGPIFLVRALVNAALVGGLAIGVMLGKEGAWIAFLLLAGASTAFQLAAGVGLGDPMVLLAGAFNAAIVGLVIWAGRALPERETPAPA